MRKFAASDIGQLDRWLVTFDGQPHGYTPAMNNYFDVGIIAQVAHRFHTRWGGKLLRAGAYLTECCLVARPRPRSSPIAP